MNYFPLEALVAIVNRETAIINDEIARCGSSSTNPRTDAFIELCQRWEHEDSWKEGGKDGH